VEKPGLFNAKGKGVTMDENELSKIIVESAIEVHKMLGGPGLLESVYRDAMDYEITHRGVLVEKEKPVPVRYKGELVSAPLKLDLLVGRLVIVECKAVMTYNPIFESQTLTYLRLTGLKLGIVINFGQRLVKHGIHRVVNGL
jgi:GxxExxY protein